MKRAIIDSSSNGDSEDEEVLSSPQLPRQTSVLNTNHDNDDDDDDDDIEETPATTTRPLRIDLTQMEDDSEDHNHEDKDRDMDAAKADGEHRPLATHKTRVITLSDDSDSDDRRPPASAIAASVKIPKRLDSGDVMYGIYRVRVLSMGTFTAPPPILYQMVVAALVRDPNQTDRSGKHPGASQRISSTN